MSATGLALPDGERARAWRWLHLALVAGVAASWLLFSGLNFWMGELNQDEGWYLYAAGQIREGRLPYRDFAFTQAPLMPLVYSWGYHWVERFGLAGGRALTWIFGSMGLLASVWLAMRTGPRNAQRLSGGLCFVLAGINLYQLYFTTIVKTYALSGMFLAAGLAALSFVGRKRALRSAVLAGFLLACAAATRISLGAALPLAGLYLVAFRRRLRPWAWLDFGLGGGLGLGVTLLAFGAIGGEGFRFGLLDYHALRDAGTLGSQLVYKVGCVSRLVQAYFPAVATCALFVGAWGYRKTCRRTDCESQPARWDPDAQPKSAPPHFNAFVWVTAAVLAGVHLAAPFPYDDYQVPVYPILCAALAASFARGWVRLEGMDLGGCGCRPKSARRMAILTAAWVVCGLHAFASPVAQGWFVAGRDRIWWRLRGESPVAQLREVGRRVGELAREAGSTELLTQDAYVAVEAGLSVPRGMEMGPFSYYPDWPAERARQIGVLNRESMVALLESPESPPIAALSGYSLSIRSPEVEEISEEDRRRFEDILERRYEKVETVPLFGQAATTLEVWRRKDASKPLAGRGP
jgi:hypothetical protein